MPPSPPAVPFKCPACDGTAESYALSKGAFQIYRCETCGLGRTLLSSNFDSAAYYDESYFQGGVADGYADYQGSADALRLEFRHIIRDLLPLCKGGRLLEFGCAYGFFLDEAAPHFGSVHGVEYSDAAARSCRQRGLDVKTGPVEEELLEGVYDTVVGLDVIEHVRDPYDVVRVLAKHMPPSGILVMTTGDWASFSARVLGSRWRLMTPPQHLWFFTPAAMNALLKRNGLELVSLTHPWKRVPLSLVAYQLERMVGVTPRRMPWLNRLAIPLTLGDAMRVVARKA